MKTLNKKLKVTDSELNELNELFKDGKILVRKVVLFGAGHPQLPALFCVKMDESDSEEFWVDHETTHANFIKYDCVRDIERDSNFLRSDLVDTGQDFMGYMLPCFE